VVSTLAFHHMTPDQQERALAEVRRVLRPGGRFVIADLTLPHNHLMRLVQHLSFGLLRHRHRQGEFHHPHDGMQIEHPPAPMTHREGHAHPKALPHGHPRRMTMLEHLLASNGWRSIAPIERSMSAIGTIALYTLTRPVHGR
jgi:SAM-dependent methyltransferase